MYWLDNNTGIPTAPTIPPVISAAKRYFTNGGAGVQPSVPEDFWFNMITDELLGVLDMAGIAPDKDDLGQLAKAIQSIAFSAYPVGSPIPWPTAVPPSGFIALIGQSFSAATYPKLAVAYPSLVLPDMRGQFIRGFDAGKGIDPGRSLLTLQGFLTAPNGLAVLAQRSKGAPGSPMPVVNGGNNFFLFHSNGSGALYDDTTLSSVVSTNQETRPVNISFYYIVRAE